MSTTATESVSIDLETASPAAIRRFLRPEPVQRSVVRRSADGTELGEVALEPSIFGIEPNLTLLHQVVTAQLAAARAGTQSTKTRAEVRGGGAKPFRQKGTGRARQGSTRSPQWIGGGVALGPKPRSYAQKTPKKMIQQALRSALSDRASQGRIALIDAWTFDVPSTKAGLAALAALGVTGRVLVVLGEEDGYADRSFGNLPEIQTIVTGELNAYDILVNDWVVFTDATLPGGSGPAVVDGSATDTPVSDDPEADQPVADSTDDSGASDSTDDVTGSDSTEEGTEEDSAEAEGAGS
jgi:large subunit ribosomal protein L4